MTPAPTLDLVKPAIEVVENYSSSGTQPLLSDPSTLSLTEEIASATQRSAKMASAATVAITSAYYSRLLDSIHALTLEEEEDDRPTNFATELPNKLLSGAAEKLALDFPAAYVTVGPSSSLRISWTDRGRHVRLVCGGSPQNRTYVYLEHGRRHGVAEKLTADGLASSLLWMMTS